MRVVAVAEMPASVGPTMLTPGEIEWQAAHPGGVALKSARPSSTGFWDAAGYIRESIVEPNAHVLVGPTYAAGGRSLMPSDYTQTLKPEQIDQIVAYLLTLR